MHMDETQETGVEQLPKEYSVIVVGAGAQYEDHHKQTLDKLGPGNLRILVDQDPTRFTSPNTNGLAVVADATTQIFDFSNHPYRDRLVALVATPEHFKSIVPLIRGGVERFVVEKPLVHNSAETRELAAILARNPDVQIFPIDHYIQKSYPLLALAGNLDPNGRQWKTLQLENGDPVPPELAGKLFDMIGLIKSIDITIVEGGDLGVPDLKNRPWLMTNTQIGGMLSDLGTHALTPPFVSGLLDPDFCAINSVNRHALDANMQSFIPFDGDRPEIKAVFELSFKHGNSTIPVNLTVAKTFEGPFDSIHQWRDLYPDNITNNTVGIRPEGIWRLAIVGTNANLIFDLRTGGKLVIESANEIFSLRIRAGLQPYANAFSDARDYFAKIPLGYDPLRNMVKSIELIDRIKNYPT